MSSRWDVSDDKFKQLDAHELLNAPGRAGRAGEGGQGFVLVVPHRTIRRVIEDVLGGATPVHEISREACRELFEVLRWLPVNHSRKFGKLTVREAVALAKADRRIKTINGKAYRPVQKGT